MQRINKGGWRFGDVRPSRLRARIGRMLAWFLDGALAEREWLDRQADEKRWYSHPSQVPPPPPPPPQPEVSFKRP